MVGGLEVATEEEGESVARASGLSAHGEGRRGGGAKCRGQGGGSRGACVHVQQSHGVAQCCGFIA